MRLEDSPPHRPTGPFTITSNAVIPAHSALIPAADRFEGFISERAQENIRKMVDESAAALRCIGCAEQFKSHRRLKVHVRQHFTILVCGCLKLYRSRDSLRNHRSVARHDHLPFYEAAQDSWDRLAQKVTHLPPFPSEWKNEEGLLHARNYVIPKRARSPEASSSAMVPPLVVKRIKSSSRVTDASPERSRPTTHTADNDKEIGKLQGRIDALDTAIDTLRQQRSQARQALDNFRKHK